MHTPPPLPIPVGIEQQAARTLHAMLERGLKNPKSLTSTCRQVAVVVLSKWNEADKKAIRTLTNRMVVYAYEHEGV